MFLFLALLINFSIFSVNCQPGCSTELTFGKLCAQNRSTTKWYYDTKLEFCYPYKYLGCEEGSNSFESQDQCLESCKPADQFSCGGNTNANGVCFSPTDSGCKSGTTCVMGGTVGFCCDKSIQDQWNKEHSPECQKGNVVQFEQWFGKTPLIGHKCEHNFCPNGSKCVQGKWTAHCCQ